MTTLDWQVIGFAFMCVVGIVILIKWLVDNG